MDTQQLRNALDGGKRNEDGLICIVVHLSSKLAETTAKLTDVTAKLSKAERRIAELERKDGGGTTEKLDQAYSLAAEERRRQKRALVKAREK